MRNALDGLLGGNKAESVVPTAPRPSSLKDTVELDASKYVSQEEAAAAVIDILKSVSEYKPHGDFAALFDLDVAQLDSYDGLPSLAEPGEWILRGEREYFADVFTNQVTLDASGAIPDPLELAMRSTVAPGGKRVLPSGWTVKRQVVGIKSTFDLPYACIRVTAKRRQPNINSSVWYLVPLMSRTHIALFSAFATCRNRGWDAEEPVLSSTQWLIREVPLGPPAPARADIALLIDGFCSFAVKPVRDRFGPLLEHGEKDPVPSAVDPRQTNQDVPKIAR